MSRTNNKNCMWPCRQKYNNDIKNKTHNRDLFIGKKALWWKNYATSFLHFFLIISYLPFLTLIWMIFTFDIFISRHFTIILHICFCFTVSFIAFSSSPCSYFLFYWLFRIPRHFLVFYHNFILNPFFVYHLISTFSLFSAFKSCISCLLSQFHIISLNLYVFYFSLLFAFSHL